MLQTEATFIPAFAAGIVAITVSQPFEVLRNHISLNKGNEAALSIAHRYFSQTGFRGFFIGFVPRLVRKPINSGICWTILESLRSQE
jgi:solute carrier family 25 protein 38